MANQRIRRGISPGEEVDEKKLYRDTRSGLQKALDNLRSLEVVATILFVIGACSFIFRSLSELGVVIALGIAAFAVRQRESAPLKLPIQSGLLDPNEVIKGDPKQAQGIFFLGNDKDSGKEIWLTNSDCRQHFLVLGTTGSGKTETLLGFCANALSWGSGFLFCDGKGDISLFAKVYALARLFGREDDLLVLNFMTGNQDVGFEGGHKLSNTTNPFSAGSADNLTQMIVSLMEEAGGDNAMWKGRAQALVSAEISALVHLRDQGLLNLDVGVIRDHMTLHAMYDLAYSDEYNFPQHIRNKLQKFMETVPGFKPEKGYQQSQQTFDQFGFLAMQLTKVLTSLADVYGHVFSTPAGEIDMNDVVLNRRILVIMLPSLEKSPDEVASLGKVIVSQVKNMAGGTLGNELEGDWRKVVEQRLTNAPSPFQVILDEVGYYTANGMAMLSAQARSLGLSLIFAAQDVQSMQRNVEKVETDSIIANTNTKLFMKTEEPDTTAQLAQSLAGKAKTMQASGFQADPNKGGMHYRDTLEARVEEKERISPVDLKAQGVGETLVLRDDLLIYADTFYAAPEDQLNKYALRLRTNHFIKIPKPRKQDLIQQMNLPRIKEILMDPRTPQRFSQAGRKTLKKRQTRARQGDEIAAMAVVMDKLSNKNLVEASCGAIADVAEEGASAQSLLQKEAERSGESAASFAQMEQMLSQESDQDTADGTDHTDTAHHGDEMFASLPEASLPEAEDAEGISGDLGSDNAGDTPPTEVSGTGALSELSMFDELRGTPAKQDTEHTVDVDETSVPLADKPMRSRTSVDVAAILGEQNVSATSESQEDSDSTSTSEQPQTAHENADSAASSGETTTSSEPDLDSETATRIEEGIESVFSETGNTQTPDSDRLQQTANRVEQAAKETGREEHGDEWQGEDDPIPPEDLSEFLDRMAGLGGETDDDRNDT